jgi:hypothetical protein
LEVGLVSAVAIIEPRRKGKTTFILNDLMPAAQKAGFLPIYIGYRHQGLDSIIPGHQKFGLSCAKQGCIH